MPSPNYITPAGLGLLRAHYTLVPSGPSIHLPTPKQDKVWAGNRWMERTLGTWFRLSYSLSFYFPFLLSSSCYFNGAGRGKGKGEGEGIESTGNIWFVEEDFHIPQLPIPFLYLTGNWGTKRKSSIVKPYIPGPLPSFLSLTPLLPFIGFRWRGRRKKAEANKKEVWR